MLIYLTVLIYLTMNIKCCESHLRALPVLSPVTSRLASLLNNPVCSHLAILLISHLAILLVSHRANLRSNHPKSPAACHLAIHLVNPAHSHLASHLRCPLNSPH